MKKIMNLKSAFHSKQLGMILFLTLIACFTVRAAEPEPKPKSNPEGLVGYWKLNEGSGTTVYDSSGNKEQGEIVGNAKWATDKSGPVLSFDGETSIVKIPDGKWNNGYPVTLMCWFKPERMPEGQNNGSVFNHVASGVIPGSYSLNASGGFNGYGGVSEGPIDYAKLKGTDLSMPVQPEEWHFIAVVIDRKELRGYLDGQLAVSKEIDAWPRVEGPLSLGARNLTEKNDRFFKGTIREMAVFNRTLTAEEIAAIHAAYVKGQSLSAPAATPAANPVATPAAAPKTP
jgi:hypothetical protein